MLTGETTTHRVFFVSQPGDAFDAVYEKAKSTLSDTQKITLERVSGKDGALPYGYAHEIFEKRFIAGQRDAKAFGVFKPPYDLLVACIEPETRASDEAGNAACEIGAWVALYGDSRVLIFRTSDVVLPIKVRKDRDHVFGSEDIQDRATQIVATVKEFFHAAPCSPKPAFQLLLCDEPRRPGQECEEESTFSSTDVAMEIKRQLLPLDNEGTTPATNISVSVFSDSLGLTSSELRWSQHNDPLLVKRLTNSFDYVIYIVGPDKQLTHEASLRSFLSGYWHCRRRPLGSPLFDYSFVLSTPRCKLPSDFKGAHIVGPLSQSEHDLQSNLTTRVAEWIPRIRDTLVEFITACPGGKTLRMQDPYVNDLTQVFHIFDDWEYDTFFQHGFAGSSVPSDLVAPVMSILSHSERVRVERKTIDDSIYHLNCILAALDDALYAVPQNRDFKNIPDAVLLRYTPKLLCNLAGNHYAPLLASLQGAAHPSFDNFSSERGEMSRRLPSYNSWISQLISFTRSLNSTLDNVSLEELTKLRDSHLHILIPWPDSPLIRLQKLLIDCRERLAKAYGDSAISGSASIRSNGLLFAARDAAMSLAKIRQTGIARQEA